MNFVDFISDLAGLPIVGVDRQYDYWPSTLPSGDLPMSFVRFASGSSRKLTSGGVYWATYQCELVVIVESYPLGRNRENHVATHQMMDSVGDAVTAADLACGPVLLRGIREAIIELGDTGYWAVVALVESTG